MCHTHVQHLERQYRPLLPAHWLFNVQATGRLPEYLSHDAAPLPR